MKPCKVRAVLLKRLAYLEVFLQVKGQSLAPATRNCILDEADALRSVLGQLGLLDEERLEELRLKERARSLGVPRQERAAS